MARTARALQQHCPAPALESFPARRTGEGICGGGQKAGALQAWVVRGPEGDVLAGQRSHRVLGPIGPFHGRAAASPTSCSPSPVTTCPGRPQQGLSSPGPDGPQPSAGAWLLRPRALGQDSYTALLEGLFLVLTFRLLKNDAQNGFSERSHSLGIGSPS